MILRQCGRAGAQLPGVLRFFSSANSTSGIRPAIDGSAVFLLSQNGPAAAALRPSGWYFYSTAPALRPSRGPAAAALRPSGCYFYSTAAAEPSPQEPLRPKDGSTSESESELPQEKENPFLQERKELLAKIDEMNDKYKRALAEIENVRRRLTKQAEETKNFWNSIDLQRFVGRRGRFGTCDAIDSARGIGKKCPFEVTF